MDHGGVSIYIYIYTCVYIQIPVMQGLSFATCANPLNNRKCPSTLHLDTATNIFISPFNPPIPPQPPNQLKTPQPSMCRGPTTKAKIRRKLKPHKSNLKRKVQVLNQMETQIPKVQSQKEARAVPNQMETQPLKSNLKRKLYNTKSIAHPNLAPAILANSKLTDLVSGHLSFVIYLGMLLKAGSD